MQEYEQPSASQGTPAESSNAGSPEKNAAFVPPQRTWQQPGNAPQQSAGISAASPQFSSTESVWERSGVTATGSGVTSPQQRRTEATPTSAWKVPDGTASQPGHGTASPQLGGTAPQRPVPPAQNIWRRPVNMTGETAPHLSASAPQPKMGATPSSPAYRPPVSGMTPNSTVPGHGRFQGTTGAENAAQPMGATGNVPGNWYTQPQNFQGWQTPPPVPPMAGGNGGTALPPAERRDRRTAFWLKVVSVLLVLVLVYCIGSDIAAYRFGWVVPGTSTSDSDEGDWSGEVDTEEDSTGDSGVPSGDGTGAEVIIQQEEKPTVATEDTGTEATTDGAYTVEGVAAAVRPSIVEIYTYMDEDGTELSGTGSGIILSSDGYIITNAHVLTDGKSFTVFLSDESEYTAEVVGSDSKTDLAVLRVDATGLPAATMGDSDEVVLGEAVVAIGNPAGLTGSVTNGIVSGLNREIRSDSTGYAMNCIQTNAAISPGNSGGALVNMYGQVIGITSSKYVSSSYEGLGFAITINEVLPIVEDLIQYGKVKDRVRIGITFISLESSEIQIQFADALGMDAVPSELEGIWVTEIDSSCSVAETDLQANDVIVAADGNSVTDYDTLLEAISEKKPGDQMQADCRRYDADGNYTEFSITFELMDDSAMN